MATNPFGDPDFGLDDDERRRRPQINPFADPDFGRDATLGESLVDTTVAGTRGALVGTKAISDAAGANNRVSRALDTAAEFVGGFESAPRRAEREARQRKIEEAERSGSTADEVGAYLGAFAEAPLDTTVEAIGTSIPTIAGAIATRGRSLGTPAAIGGVQGAGITKGSIYEAVERAYLERGASAEEAAAHAQQAQAYNGKNYEQILLGAGLGAVAGSSGIESAVGRMIGNRAGQGIVRSTVTGALTEAPLEGLQGGQERFASNLAERREGFDTPLMEGVLGSAALEAVAGGAAGTGFGFAEGLAARDRPELSPPTDEQSPPPDELSPPPPEQSPPQAPPAGPQFNAPPQAPILTGSPGQVPPEFRRERAGRGTPAPKLLPSQQMGLDPAAGPLTTAAATAVDTGLSQTIAAAAEQAEVEREIQAPLDLVEGELVDHATGEVIASPELRREGLLERLAFLRQQARTNGWSTQLTKQRAAIEGALQEVAGETWTAMSREQREAVVSATDIKGVLRKNLPTKSDWAKLNPEVRAKLTAAIDSPAGEIAEIVPEQPTQPPQEVANVLQTPERSQQIDEDARSIEEEAQPAAEPAPQSEDAGPAALPNFATSAEITSVTGITGEPEAATDIYKPGDVYASDTGVYVQITGIKKAISEFERDTVQAQVIAKREGAVDGDRSVRVGEFWESNLGLEPYRGPGWRKEEKPEPETADEFRAADAAASNTKQPPEDATKAPEDAKQNVGTFGDIHAITRKQIPEMTDDELVQAIEHYGPDHKRTGKLKKEQSKRGSPAPSAQPAWVPKEIKLNKFQLRELETGGVGLSGELQPSAMRSLIAMRDSPNVVDLPRVEKYGPDSSVYDSTALPPLIDVGSGIKIRGYRKGGEVIQEIHLPNGMIATRNLDPDGSLSGSFEGDFDQIVRGEGIGQAEKMLSEFGRQQKLSAPAPASVPEKARAKRLEELNEARRQTVAGTPARRDLDADIRKLGAEPERFDEPSMFDDEPSTMTQAAAEVDTTATDAQKEAGNYKKGHVTINGMEISIENPAGTRRRPEWPPLAHHYGYFRGTVGKDKDHVDVFLTDNAEDLTRPVYVVDQVTRGGVFDEHKVILGASNSTEARQAYQANYGKGWSGFGGMEKMSWDQFKEWVRDPANTAKPAVQPEPAPTVKESLTTEPAPAAKPAEYGSTNKLVSKDRAEELRKRLKAKFNELRTGIDPEMLAIGTELAVFHIEAGARKFLDVAQAISDDIGVSLDRLKPYLRGWYNGARDTMEDNGLDVSDMDSTEIVREQLQTIGNADERTEIRSDGAESLETVAPETGGDAGERGPDAGSDSDSGQERVSGGSGADAAGLPAARGGRSGTKKPRTTPTGSRGKRGALGDGGTTDDGPTTPQLPDDPRVDVEGELTGAPNIPATNFQITDDTQLGRGGEVAKFNNNIAAIRALKKIESEQRRATFEEQQILARYVGWGGLANAFPDPTSGKFKDKWEARGNELRELLTDEEYTAARRSTRNAHYTAENVVTAMWRAVERLGFSGGLVLEPSMGTGNFLGLAPSYLPARFIGVEYDSLTARMGQALYPQATVLHSGFQKLPIAENTFALAIGNPPFGSESLRFQFKPELAGLSIHNQFFLASMDALRPGGIQAMVVSRYLMDAKDRTTRLALAKKAKLVGLIRLPDNAFKENARTEVVTDIVILQKLEDYERDYMERVIDVVQNPPKKPTEDDMALAQELPTWVRTEEIPDPLGGEPMTVNAHFVRNQQDIMGVMERSGSMQRGADITVRLDNIADLGGMLQKAIDRLPENIHKLSAEVMKNTEARFAAMSESLRISLNNEEVGHVKTSRDGKLLRVIERETEEGGFEFREQEITPESPWSEKLNMDDKGRWYQLTEVLDEKGQKVKILRDGKATRNNLYERKVYEKESDIPDNLRLGKTKFERLQGLVKLRDLVKRQLQLETADAAKAVMEGNRKALAAEYAAFTKKHGPINRSVNLALAMTMPDGGLIAALEVGYQPERTKAQADKSGLEAQKEEATPAPIMTSRVVPKYEPRTKADSPADALVINLAETGRVNMERIAGLLGVDQEAAAASLQQGDKPLVFMDPETQQWETADAYLSGSVKRKLKAAQAAGLTLNAQALEKVIPEDWGAENVSVQLGSTWVPPSVYADFVQHLMGGSPTVQFSKLTNSFNVNAKGADAVKAEAWSSEGAPAAYIVGRLLNSQAVVVTYTDSDGKSHVDGEKTALAGLKAREIVNEFTDWIFKDSDRREQLVEIFNELFNTRVVRQFDGQHLTLPGKVPDSIIKMRRHQMNAIWRGIYERFMLVDHAVGAGKTFTAIARAMERRRMGLSRKPMIVVPNHLVEQWAADVYRLYPGAKVLAAGKEDFKKHRRRRLFGKVATGDWDIVIVPHSSFGFIGIAPETEMRFLEQELTEAKAAIEDAQKQAEADGLAGGRRKPFGVKEAERLAEKIQQRMDKITSGVRDRLLTFEQLGVDDLTVDEAHEFKNLAYSSRLTGVRGMGDKSGSRKANDLYNKVRVLREHPSATVTFLTGTPISNSAVEMFTMLRYLAADALDEMGMTHFDAFRAQFVEATPAFEPTESGRLKEVTRLGRTWSNMRSLMDLYYQVTDAVSLDDIKEWYAKDTGKSFPVPKVKGGKDRELVAIKPTPAQEEALKTIMDGFDSLDGIQDPYERNAERLRLMDRARKVSLDIRAVNPLSKSKEEGGKLEVVSQNIKRIYDQWDSDKGTQLVFLDRSVPKSKGDDAILKAYDALIAKRDEALAKGDDDAFGEALEELDKYDSNEIAELRSAQTSSWNAYQQIKDNLVAMGIPANEIRFVQEANNDEQKAALFDAVNGGKVRVLIGSTPRMGAGTNVQQRAVALHHVDVTWKPSDIEQREGRVIRQGNRLLEKYGPNFEVEIIAYATERTVDAKMWDLNATKLRTINGIRKYDGAFSMEFEDEEAVGMAEMAALASGNPLLLERVKLEAEIGRLELQERAHQRKMWAVQDQLKSYERIIERNPGRIEQETARVSDAKAALERVEREKAARTVTIEGTAYATMPEAYRAAEDAQKSQQAGNDKARYSITINGERVTTKEGINEAIGAALGDKTPYEAVIAGTRTYQNTVAARLITDILNRTKLNNDGDGTAELGEFFGYTLVADITQARRENRIATLTLQDSAGRTVASEDSGAASEGTFVPANIRPPLDRLVGRLESAAEGFELSRLKRELNTAKANIEDVRGRQGQRFAKADELVTMRKRLEELVRELEAGKNQPDAETDASALGTILQSGAEPEAFTRFRDLGRESVSIEQSMKDVAALIGFDVPFDIEVRDDLPEFVPMRFNLDTGRIEVSASVPMTRAEQAQFLMEEVLHGIDVVGPDRTISATSKLLDEAGGVYREVVQVYESNDRLRTFLSYPLNREVHADLSSDQVKAELFARLGVLYLGDPQLMKEVLPNAYKAYHGLFGLERESPVAENFVLRKVWKPRAGRAGQVLREHGTVRGSDWDAGGKNQRGPAGRGLGELRGAIGREFQASPFGRRIQLTPRTDGLRTLDTRLQETAAGMARGLSDALGNITVENIQNAPRNLRGSLKNRGADWLRIGLQWLGRRQLVDIYGGDFLPLEGYATLAEKMQSDENQVAAKADEIAQRWGKVADQKALADLMHDATLAGIDADDLVVYEGPNMHEAMALRGRFAQLTPEAKAIYRETRDTYKEHHQNVLRAMKDRVRRSEMNSARKAELLQRMDAEFYRSVPGVYFPLQRFGKYVVTAHDASGRIATVQRAETMPEAQALRKDLLQKFPESGGYQVSKVALDKDFAPSRDSVGRGFISSLYEALDEMDLGGRQHAELSDTIGQLYLSSFPDMSWAKHGIHRKGTPGFSDDARRAFAQNMFHGGRHLAKLRYNERMLAELENVQKYADGRKNEEDFDQPRAQRVIDEMVKRHEAMINPKTNALTSAATSLGFVFFLGFSPAAAIVNISQTALVGLPIMGAKWGFDKSSAALLKASGEALKGKNNIRASLTPEEQRAYDLAVMDGTIDVTQAHDLANIAQGEDEGIMWKLRPLMRMSSYLFHQAEVFNRQVTFVASYRLARESGVGPRTAFLQARKATYDTHFDYSTSNRARVTQGNIAKMVLLFKQYAQNMIYTITRNAYQSFAGESPQVRREARRAFTAIMGLHMLAAGALGLPVVGPILWALSAALSDDDEPWDAEVAMRNGIADLFGGLFGEPVGRRISEVLSRGVSRLTPLDISGRVALNSLIFPDMQEGLEGARWAERFITQALGPVASMIIVNPAKALSHLGEGRWQQALESFMPVAASNALKSFRFASEGVVDRSGVVVRDEVSWTGVGAQFVGFAPSEVRRSYEGREAIYNTEQRLNSRRSELLRAISMASIEGDREAVAEARQEIAEFNRKNPSRAIKPANIMQSVKNRRRRIEQAEQGVYLPKNRREALEAGRFADY